MRPVRFGRTGWAFLGLARFGHRLEQSRERGGGAQRIELKTVSSRDSDVEIMPAVGCFEPMNGRGGITTSGEESCRQQWWSIRRHPAPGEI